MASEYQGVVTLAGQAALAGSVGGTPLSLTTIRVGDGNGNPITPNETMTDLIHRVGGAYTITSSGRDVTSPNIWRVGCTIPESDGPFDIREIAVFDSTGAMIAIAKHPLVTKTSTAQGNAVAISTEIIFPIASGAQINLTLQTNALIDIGEMVRAPFMVVEGADLTAPPGSPGLGDTYVVPASGASGAWAGFGNRLAQWNGSVWASKNVPAGHLVVDRSKATSDVARWIRRISGGDWGSAVATESEYGVTRFLDLDARYAPNGPLIAGLVFDQAASTYGGTQVADGSTVFGGTWDSSTRTFTFTTTRPNTNYFIDGVFNVQRYVENQDLMSPVPDPVLTVTAIENIDTTDIAAKTTTSFTMSAATSAAVSSAVRRQRRRFHYLRVYGYS